MLTEQEDTYSMESLSEKEKTSMANAINRFLEGISLEKRVIILRRYWFCDAYAEIASRYGMRERKVKRIILDTREELCAYLEKPWGTFGISQIDSKFVREAEDDYILREGSSVIIGYRSMLNDIFQILFERFLSFPEHA